ncbi:hypothetical protein SUGI_0857970 [Cryptomeria japonica]|nr:hypothetical protein SUGI_0857970 [Cryptomeria japonica]
MCKHSSPTNICGGCVRCVFGSCSACSNCNIRCNESLFSMHRYPYFIRMVPNDKLQMRAIAKLIQNYRWRDVALVYVDDDMGRVAIHALEDALRGVKARIVFTAAVSPQADTSAIRSIAEGTGF